MHNATGKRIKYFRNKCGMTQRGLGMALGLSEGSGDIRVSQYEQGTRNPGHRKLEKIAEIFGISPEVLTPADIYSGPGLMSILLAIEDNYNLEISLDDEDVIVRFIAGEYDQWNPKSLALFEWGLKNMARDQGVITEDEYDKWRYGIVARLEKEEGEN